MAALEAVSTDDLRQDSAEVEDKKPTQRFMVDTNYLEDDYLTLRFVVSSWRSVDEETRSQ